MAMAPAANAVILCLIVLPAPTLLLVQCVLIQMCSPYKTVLASARLVQLERLTTQLQESVLVMPVFTLIMVLVNIVMS